MCKDFEGMCKDFEECVKILKASTEIFLMCKKK